MCGCVSQHAPGLTFLSPENMTLSDPTDPVWQGMGGGVVAGGGMTKSPALQLLINKSCLVHLTWWSGWAQAVETRRSEFLQVTCQMWWYFHLFFMVVKTTKTNKQTNKPTRWAEEENNFNCVYLYSGSAAAVQSVKAALVPSRGLYIIFQHEKYKYSVCMISSPFSCVYFHLVCCCYNFRFATTHAPENETGENSQAVVKNTHAAILLQS